MTARNRTDRSRLVKPKIETQRFAERNRWICLLAREGISIASIADHFGLAASTVRKILSQAAKRSKRKGRR